MKKCYFCSEMIEDQMKVCPWCGRRQLSSTIDEPKEKPSNTDFLESIVSKDKRESIGREAKWTSVWLGIIALFGQQLILNTKTVKTLYSPIGNYLNPGVASIEDYLTIWNTFVISAPLVLVIAIFYLFWKGKEERSEGLAPGHFMVGAFLLYLAAAFGNAAGFASVRTAGLRGGTPYAQFSLMLSDYFNSYGFVLFASSIIVGIFIGRAWKTLVADG